MDENSLIQELENEWAEDEGFFWRLRMEGFDPEGFARVEKLLSVLDKDSPLLSRRLVSLVWFIPRFMSWQETPTLDSDTYASKVNRLESLIIDAFGAP